VAIDCKKNPKRFWQYINKKAKVKTSIGDLRWLDTNGIEKLAQDDRDKAMALQEFFSSVYTREPDNDFDKLRRRVNDQFQEIYDFNICQEKLKRNLNS